MINPTEFQQKTLDLIKQHPKSDPITGAQIALRIGLKERDKGKAGADMRSIIHALRVKGFPICASGRGYYCAKTDVELNSFIDEFQGRINNQQAAVNGLRSAFKWVGNVTSNNSVLPPAYKPQEPEIIDDSQANLL